jgi:uncharacterized protein with FMN-binding domain
MRRAPFVLTATAAGLAGVLSYHARGGSLASLHAPGSPRLASLAHHSQHRGPVARRSSSVAGQATTGAGSLPAPLLAGSGSGPLVAYGYGELAVQVTVSKGRIASVQVTGLRTADQYSEALALQVIPLLRSEVLHAQSANINGVSGATYTSEAFATSLQAALSHLHG